MMNEHGLWIWEDQEVIQDFVQCYEDFLGFPIKTTELIKDEIVCIRSVLDISWQIAIIRPFTKEDGRKALFSIPNHKSPDPDSYHSGFLEIIWREGLGVEVCLAILEFFQQGTLFTQWNQTGISLIPEVANPTIAADYRPIGCGNTSIQIYLQDAM